MDITDRYISTWGLLFLLFPARILANWMYLGVVGVALPPPNEEEESFCKKVPGLVTQQLQVCQSNPQFIPSVSEGARRGITECQYQFRYERWNCTTNHEYDVFGLTLSRGSKETAFIYSVTSAGVVHAVTQSCSLGNLTECSCDMSRQGKSHTEGWKWGGCSDNIKYGVMFSKNFVDAPERMKHQNNRNVKNLMNLHNNEAGRRGIERLMKVQCRCHGVSGSCELKTCWKTIPTFKEVGELLKEKYDRAIQVSARSQKKLRRKDKVQKKKPISKDDLVYIFKSPNYCVEDKIKGILGTSGRMCNKTSSGPDSCDLLCCGRGYNTQVVRHVERCHCKFVWCCYVKCKTCITMVDIHTCK